MEVFRKISKEEAQSIEDQTLVFQPHVDNREEGNHFMFIGSTNKTTCWNDCGLVGEEFLSASGSTVSGLTAIISLAERNPEKFERYFSVVGNSERANFDFRVFDAIIKDEGFNWEEFEMAYPKAA
jgi:hypothetical protein